MSEADRHEIDLWIADDPGHAGKMTADFFLIRGKFHSLYAIEDELGTVAYGRQEAEGKNVRMHIQFGPNKRRVLRAFRDAYMAIACDAKKRGFAAVVFDSQSPALVKMMVTEFGCRAECTGVL